MTEPPSPLTMLFSRHTKRREFIAGLIGAAAAAWPVGARAQPERIRRIGVLMPLGESDVEGQRRIAAFTKALQDMGWSTAVALDIRYGDGKPELLPALALLIHPK
jgi:hypothetical protein